MGKNNKNDRDDDDDVSEDGYDPGDEESDSEVTGFILDVKWEQEN